VFLLLYATGARISSLCAATPADVRQDTLFLRQTKGDRPYAVPLGHVGREAAAALVGFGRATLAGVGPGRVWQWFDQASADTGIKVHPHLLRHTFASHLLQRGVDVRTVQELGGWADLSQIPRYTQVTDPRKREAVEVLG
jgi:integrase/recombinase XerD